MKCHSSFSIVDDPLSDYYSDVFHCIEMKILLGEIMYKKNLSIRQVSIMTGISKSTINRIMNGEISPTADTLECLAKGLPIKGKAFFTALKEKLKECDD